MRFTGMNLVYVSIAFNQQLGSENTESDGDFMKLEIAEDE